MKTIYNNICRLTAMMTICFLIPMWSMAQENIKNNRTKYELNGNVKTLIVSSYKVKGAGERTQNKSFDKGLSVVFRSNGTIVREKQYRSDSSYTETQYEKQGNKVSIKRFRSDGRPSLSIKFRYNDNGNPVEKTRYGPDGKQGDKTTYKYDQKGNLIQQTEYSDEGTVERKFVNKYDNKGNKIQETFYYGDGSYQRRTYRYDEKGNMIEENRSNSDGEDTGKWILKYDGDGHLVMKNNVANSAYQGRFSKEIYKYDNNGQKIVYLKITSDGSLYQKIKYAYNSKGKLSKESWYDVAENLLLEKTIRYDDNGNVVEESRYNGKRGTTTKTKITRDDQVNIIKTVRLKDGNIIGLTEYDYEYF